MEQNSSEKIINLLEKVIKLLADNDEKEWAKFLENILENFKKTDDKLNAVIPIMKSMLGGMGSLSDLVLYNGKNVLIDENNELYILLNKLYDECNKMSNS